VTPPRLRSSRPPSLERSFYDTAGPRLAPFGVLRDSGMHEHGSPTLKKGSMAHHGSLDSRQSRAVRTSPKHLQMSTVSPLHIYEKTVLPAPPIASRRGAVLEWRRAGIRRSRDSDPLVRSLGAPRGRGSVFRWRTSARRSFRVDDHLELDMSRSLGVDHSSMSSAARRSPRRARIAESIDPPFLIKL
jgi:hypothetical protein